MLLPGTTWGDLRKIHAEILDNPGTDDPDDLLSDPSVAAESIGKLDSEYYYDPVPQPADVEIYIVDDPESDEIPALLKIDLDAGDMFRRTVSEWVLVTPDDDSPELDMPYLEVSEGAVQIWDTATEPLTKFDFRSVLLDGI